MQKFKIWIFKLIHQLEKLAIIFGGNSIWLLSVSGLIAISMLFLNDQLIMSTREKTDALANIDQLINETWKTRARLAVAESAQHGYLLTKLDDYFHPYAQASAELSEHLRRMDRILIQANLGENQAFQDTLGELISAVSKKSAEMRVAVDFAKRRQFDQALAVVKLNEGIKEGQHIEALIQRFETDVQVYRSRLIEERNFSRNLTRWVVMISPFILMILVVVVIRRLLYELAEKAKLHALLQQENSAYQQSVAQLKTTLQGLALEAQTDVERERFKLARELHDELGSLLTAIKMDIAWSIKQISNQLPLVTEKLKKTNQYLDRSINFKREVVQNLHPSMINNFGLVASLQNLMDEAKVRNRWEMSVILPATDLAINDTVALIIYRIVQESLNNTSKYAKATSVSVHMIEDGQHIKVEISDNGVGFDAATLSANTHGIKGMRHRVESIGGHYEITSAPQQGTNIRVLLPHIPKETAIAV